MKLVETSTLTVSQDTGTTPTQIRYSEAISDTDTTSILKSVTIQTEFPIGVHTIDLGQIVTGKVLLIKPTANLLVNINGADTDYTIKAGKMSKIWADITALEIEVTGAAQIVSIFVGGV
jgi:hypothetical protein